MSGTRQYLSPLGVWLFHWSSVLKAHPVVTGIRIAFLVRMPDTQSVLYTPQSPIRLWLDT